MTKLIITRGLPASGKTTWARAWVDEDPEHRIRVNRDDLRSMAHAGRYIAADAGQVGTESAIVAMQHAAVSALLLRGVDVVVDDTNLPSRAVRGLRNLATIANSEFEIVDLTNVSLEVCLQRNEERGLLVPAAVIHDMWSKYVKGRPYPVTVPDNEVEALPTDPYVPQPGKPKVILVDIDGTVALRGTRSPFDESLVHEDRPYHAVVENIRALWHQGYGVIFCSGRTAGCQTATEEWLKTHVGVPWLHLLMRPIGDVRQDAVLKLELFNTHIRDQYDVFMVLDDREQVVKMWRALGLPVFAVAEGKF